MPPPPRSSRSYSAAGRLLGGLTILLPAVSSMACRLLTEPMDNDGVLVLQIR
ncbi:hypothetical protein BDA96_02G295700 [Sorghum bicolor]|uniref:Lipoprotein n=2 Tax=Sorghum bicolor TaxID=4558 RepID=A0A921RR63_SORBI|nr:hypothetical protein BDA96_02G295700 [Sorghum bicolor]KAG0544667.1 hypothetical protein BDA96_02G295700 [Sorghum bicolor]OQU89841.1 hypothetical protein SORBI_3002G280950 [Sorghum bicolor]